MYVFHNSDNNLGNQHTNTYWIMRGGCSRMSAIALFLTAMEKTWIDLLHAIQNDAAASFDNYKIFISFHTKMCVTGISVLAEYIDVNLRSKTAFMMSASVQSWQHGKIWQCESKSLIPFFAPPKLLIVRLGRKPTCIAIARQTRIRRSS